MFEDSLLVHGFQLRRQKFRSCRSKSRNRRNGAAKCHSQEGGLDSERACPSWLDGWNRSHSGFVLTALCLPIRRQRPGVGYPDKWPIGATHSFKETSNFYSWIWLKNVVRPAFTSCAA